MRVPLNEKSYCCGPREQNQVYVTLKAGKTANLSLLNECTQNYTIKRNNYNFILYMGKNLI